MEKNTTFTARELVRAVELMISKQDIRNNPELCMDMLRYFGFSAETISETLRKGKYFGFDRRGSLGIVASK